MLPYAIPPGINPGPLFKTKNDNNIVVNDNFGSKFEDLLQLDSDPIDIDYVLYRTEIDSVHPTQTAEMSALSGMLESDISLSVVVACLFGYLFPKPFNFDSTFVIPYCTSHDRDTLRLCCDLWWHLSPLCLRSWKDPHVSMVKLHTTPKLRPLCY